MARVLQRRIGHPPEERYKDIVSQSSESPVSVTDITNARIIFGPNVSGMRGQKTRETPVRTKDERVAIPRDLYRIHKKNHIDSRCNVRQWSPIFGDIFEKYQVLDSRIRAMKNSKITG